MMNKKEITQFAKAIIHSQKGLQNQQLMHPKREWLVGVVVALGIFSASMVWSAVQYIEYQNIENQTVVQSTASAEVYKAELVAEALSVYTAKANRLNTLLGADSSFVADDSAGEETESVGDVDVDVDSDSEPSESLDVATTTQATSSSSDNQTPEEVETVAPTETDTQSEEPTSNESPEPPTEEGSIRPAMNI
jgi:hypothetical protein